MTPEYERLIDGKGGTFIHRVGAAGKAQRKMARLLARGQRISAELAEYAAAARRRIAEIETEYPEVVVPDRELC